MQLTRKSIQSLLTQTTDLAKITYPMLPFIKFEEYNPEHLNLLEDISKNWGLKPDKATKKTWTEAQQHLSAYVDADVVLDDIIAKFNWTNEKDAARWDSTFYLMKLMVDEARKDGKKLEFKVMVMRPSERGLGERGVTNGSWGLLQGSNPSNGYPGDNSMADPDVTTIQLHCYTFKHGRTDSVIGENIVVPIIIPAKRDSKTMQLIMQS